MTDNRIEVEIKKDARIDAKLGDLEQINLVVGEGKEFAQELYVAKGKLGITYGNEVNELPYDLDPTDFLAMYTLKRGGI
ncbi:hypothetical protein [uncultured Veillonella sp.]|uniref:hypothetical protein n=1 Tax=uncultured Veillonella sp. TaxID=159268 RepID=UPI0025EFFB0F|nr:hypothetical protein [uncultured Veillonella sp.]